MLMQLHYNNEFIYEMQLSHFTIQKQEDNLEAGRCDSAAGRMAKYYSFSLAMSYPHIVLCCTIA